MPNDLLIVERVKKGDIRAFEVLFKSYYKSLCLYSVKYVASLAIAEEVVQDIFYMIWKKRGELAITTSVKSYLYKAVLNKSLQHIEHLQVIKRHQAILLEQEFGCSSSNPVISDIEYNQLEEHLAKVLATLPERRRKIFVMNRFQGKKYTEIAQELSISVKTVEAEISKAIRVLKEGTKGYTD